MSKGTLRMSTLRMGTLRMGSISCITVLSLVTMAIGIPGAALNHEGSVASAVQHNSTTEAIAASIPSVDMAQRDMAQRDMAQRDMAQREIAQSLIGQCRQTIRLERVYGAADLGAVRVIDVQPNTTVTLAGEANRPSAGWVQISTPVGGYIQTAFLVACNRAVPNTLPPVTPPVSNACGVVITESPLTIRQAPNTAAAETGALLFSNDGFRILGRSQVQTQPAAENGRVWVEIERLGVRGWVAETGAGGVGNNFRRVSCGAAGV
jgi:hypothetical protein